MTKITRVLKIGQGLIFRLKLLLGISLVYPSLPLYHFLKLLYAIVLELITFKLGELLMKLKTTTLSIILAIFLLLTIRYLNVVGG